MKRSKAIALAVAALFAITALMVIPAVSGIPEYVHPAAGGTPGASHWDFSAFAVTWQLNPSTGSNVTGSRSVADVLQASFATWQAAPNTALQVSRGPDSNSTSPGFDANSSSNFNLVCFVCQGDFSKDTGALAVTITTLEDRPGGPTGHGGHTTFVGQIIDADILFNPSTQFATSSDGTGQDLQTVATHEIGHFLGLDHSGVARAVMFPFAAPNETTLSYDDVAVVSSLYPKGSADYPPATVSGTVTLSGSGPIFGAHVFLDSTTGSEPLSGFNVRKSPIGTLTFPDGTYRITGVPADSYTVAAEPLDDPVKNGDVSDYGPAFGRQSVVTNFTTRYH
jgi:Matrixin